jgi:hypothetical protein
MSKSESKPCQTKSYFGSKFGTEQEQSCRVLRAGIHQAAFQQVTEAHC